MKNSNFFRNFLPSLKIVVTAIFSVWNWFATLECQINRWGLNNKVDWKFPGYLTGGRGHHERGDGKLKNYVFIVNVMERI